MQQSKTDQYRHGNEVVIARTKSDTCPVAMLEQYMAMANLMPAGENWLFRPLTATKHGHRLKTSGTIDILSGSGGGERGTAQAWREAR